ncbi:MAG: DUF2726 domain-containing protein [Anaerolineae bacterium]|nr:DUF2726 domain-containing protein [Anaerolineae bacterium]
MGDNQVYRNKINRKHIDFLLCEPKTMRPLLGLELDDASHNAADRQARDELVEQVFAAAGLPLLRQPVRHTYNTTELAGLLQPYLDLQTGPPLPANPSAALAALSDTLARDLGQPVPVPTTAEGQPLCPKCNAPMVLRTVRKPGPYHGNQFWGCPDYPRCRGIRQVEDG